MVAASNSLTLTEAQRLHLVQALMHWEDHCLYTLGELIGETTMEPEWLVESASVYNQLRKQADELLHMIAAAKTITLKPTSHLPESVSDGITELSELALKEIKERAQNE